MAKLSTHLRTFLEYIEIEKGRSPLTIRNYEFYLQRFIDWAKDPDPVAITHDVIHKFRLYLNRLENRENGTLRKSTQNYHLIALRSFLRFLQKRDVPTFSPDKIELAKQGSREVSFLENQDLDRLLKAPDNADVRPIIRARDKAILELFFSTGMRVSELSALERQMINLKRDELSIRGKGDKIRLVFLSQRSRSAIQEYLEMRQDDAPALFVRHDRAAPDPNELDTGEKELGPLTPRSIERLVRYYATAAGIPKKVSPHTLRHSFATDLLMNGADVRSVQSLLGHTSITTTQIYTHVTNQQLRDVHKAFHGLRQEDDEEGGDEKKGE
jgi:site-specific recombinase XerD